MLPSMDVLMDDATLAALLATGAEAPALLDVRWALGMTDGHDRYLAGHLPGAVHVDLERELAAPATATGGRHPLPDLATLQAAARRWGVRAGSRVVVYDDAAATSAARAWWLLRWAGLADVQILDGGLAAWREAGRPLETGEVTPRPGDVVLSAGHLPVVDADQVAHLMRDAATVLLDARAGERYRGEVEPVDPVAGHIPGALSAPTAANLDGEGRFLAPALLRQQFTDLGITADTDMITYCGSGITAAHLVAALAVAGFENAALYPGSWSQWCRDPRRPVASGDQP